MNVPTYEKAKPETEKLVASVMAKYHGGLASAGVLVQTIMARPNEDENGDPVGNAVTLHGYKCVAVIKILSLKDRVARGFDAEMIIDAERWEESSHGERVAIVDHELTHLDPATDPQGSVKRDDANRPKLKMRKHDRQFGWFDIVAERHGENSIEVIQAREMIDFDFRQVYLPGMEELQESGK